MGLSGRSSSEFCTLEGTAVASLGYSASFSFNYLDIQPNQFSRLVTVAPVFEMYRFTRLRFTCLPASSSGIVAMGYIGGNNTTMPSGFDYTTVSQLATSAEWWVGQTMPMTLDVAKTELKGELNWYSTNNGDGPQGKLLVGGVTSTAVTAFVRIDYTCVFTKPVPSGKAAMIYGVNSSSDDLELVDEHFDTRSVTSYAKEEQKQGSQLNAVVQKIRR
jgi:hypothetical protein